MTRSATFIMASAVGFLALGGSAAGCGGLVCTTLGNVVNTGTKAVTDTVNTGTKAVDDAAKTGQKAIDDTVKTGQNAGDDTVKTAQKALSDTVATAKKALDDAANTGRKAVGDTARTYIKAARDIIDAGKATERFIEREERGYVDSLGDAQKRLREGKVVDAVWHLSTDQYKNDNKNAAQLAQESDIINMAAQGAASFYGGPAGAAAYAAWYAYNATQNLDLALRAGILAGVTSEGLANVGAMPTDTVGEVAKKALVTGAMGGVAVAAAGGDEAAIRDGFLKSGSMVIVQAGQSYVTKTYVDPAEAKADTYCMSALSAKCSYVVAKLQHAANGEYVLDADGKPVFDTKTVMKGREAIGAWKDAVRKPDENDILGAATAYTADQNWSVSWDAAAFKDQSAKLPAVVVTYVGAGSPFADRLNDIEALTAADAATNKRPVLPTPPAPTPAKPVGAWVAASGAGGTGAPYFRRALATFNKDESAIRIGDILRAEIDLELRPAPADWASRPSLLSREALVVVNDMQSLDDHKGGLQKWLRVERLDTPVPVPSPDKDDDRVITVKPERHRLWCVDQENQIAFEVAEDLAVRGLTSQMAGRAKRLPNGSIRVQLSKNVAFLPGLDLPFQDTITAVVTKQNRLLRSDGKTRGVGLCSVVAGKT